MAYTNWGHYSYNLATGKFDIWVQDYLYSTPPNPGETLDEYELRMQALLGPTPHAIDYGGGYSMDQLLAWGFVWDTSLNQQDWASDINNIINDAFNTYGGFTAPINIPVLKPDGWAWSAPPPAPPAPGAESPAPVGPAEFRGLVCSYSKG